MGKILNEEYPAVRAADFSAWEAMLDSDADLPIRDSIGGWLDSELPGIAVRTQEGWRKL